MKCQKTTTCRVDAFKIESRKTDDGFFMAHVIGKESQTNVGPYKRRYEAEKAAIRKYLSNVDNVWMDDE